MPDKPETIAFWTGRLPHWEVEDGKYFVTLHLAGAIPVAGQRRIHEIARQLGAIRRSGVSERLRVQRMVFREMELWLDRVDRVMHLGISEVAEMVIEAIEFRDQQGAWRAIECVVMPNHLHLFVDSLSGGLKDLMEDFKSWTGHRAGRLIDLKGKRFWQREWFDHWARSDVECERIIRYIQQNPVKAGLVKNHTDWRYGSWSSRSRSPSGTCAEPTSMDGK